MASEWLVFRVEAVTGTGAKGQLQTVQHLDPRLARCVFSVLEAKELMTKLPKLRQYGTSSVNYDWPALERELRGFLPSKSVVARRQELLSYDCDGLTMERHMPKLAVLPETADQVAKILACCHRQGIPFVARGSGTGLSGGALVEQEALLVVTSRMRRILQIDL